MMQGVGGLTPTPCCVFLAARMRPNDTRTALLGLLLLGACRCDDSPPPIRKADAPRELKDEALLLQLPEVEGTPFDPSVLATALPATLGDAPPEGDIVIESMPLANGGSTSTASRTFVKGEHRITVQISDLQHAPLLREAMINAKTKLAEGKTSSKIATVQGRDAIAQVLAAQRMAIVNVVATDRLFVNVRVDPADNADIALEWANKVPLEPLTKLQPPDSAPAAPSQPPPL
jgi:hypothetical protein